MAAIMISACAPGPDCDEAAYWSAGMCVIGPPMEKACFESIVNQVLHAIPGKVPDAYSAWAWSTENLDGHDATTIRQAGDYWVETRPGLSPRRIAETMTHELMHAAELERSGYWPGDLPQREMHEKPRGYFRYVYGPNSLEQRILNGLDYSCLQ